jgi:hypothetical protein
MGVIVDVSKKHMDDPNVLCMLRIAQSSENKAWL